MAPEVKVQTPVTEVNGFNSIENLIKSLVKLQVEIVQIPFNLLPADSRRYAKDAARSAFKAVRNVVDDLSDTIDNAFAKSMENDK